MRRAQDARDRMSDDTQVGGPSGRFPPTRWSAIVAARGDDPAERTRAFETIVAAYWKPVYKYIRARWGKTNEDAKDLTQEFFARVMEKGHAASRLLRAQWRSFLRRSGYATCSASRLKDCAPSARRAAKRSTFGCSSSTTWRASASRGSPTSTWPASSASRSPTSQTIWPLPGASFAASPSQRCAR